VPRLQRAVCVFDLVKRVTSGTGVNLVADRESIYAITDFGHDASQIAALSRRKRGGKAIVQRA
jgi:hypothetical protein